MIEVRSSLQEQGGKPLGRRGYFWIAECRLDDGRSFSARSQAGAPNELARQLVAAGVPDQPMQTYNARTGLKELYFRSFYEAAKWTYSEGNGTLRRVKYVAPKDLRGGD